MLLEATDALVRTTSKKRSSGKQCVFGYRKSLSQSFVSNRRVCR
ncbi:hypothetical protein CES86_0042 [Brucella lupini]|uniref:Uncharacterized protein n=1 Tax=Brucella lupini TaxID=255457 RepID=A0A256H062_9HYPH|nr:hypothetical protein CES86_0042 [Brucella lupini]